MDGKQIIAVIGSGTMGNGIAHVSALSGYLVFLVDINNELLEKAIHKISTNMQKQADKGTISEEQKATALNAITTTTDMSDVKNADLVIEAAPENQSIKNEIFANLDSICKPEAILASNTSSISITDLGVQTNREDKVIGMHFMNPVPIMKLVEVVNGSNTSVETKTTIIEFAKNMDKIHKNEN